ncbi:hypothetical protein Efla_000600 [Eimeria flavescens]
MQVALSALTLACHDISVDGYLAAPSLLCARTDPNDPVAQQELLHKAHQKNMRPTWICFGLVLVLVLAETGRALYSAILQQWVEEAALHTNKELNSYLEFQYAMYSTFSSRDPSFCYEEFVEKRPKVEIPPGEKERNKITEALKAYTPSLCIYKKDLYFFEEPTGELASNSLPDLINMAYACGREFAMLLKGVKGDLVNDIYEYTQRKIYFIDVAFQLLETPTLTASQWCGVALDDEDVALMHSTSVALDNLSRKIKENESRDANTLAPVIMMVILFFLLNPLWKRKSVFKRVFHQRFEHLWNNLQKIDQVLQRKLENLVMVLQCVTEQRILGRLKIICGVQSILVSSDAPPGLMQMMRLMELLAHRVLHHANTASLHVRLELQSSAETKEMVNMRLLLDGCLEVYKNDIRARGGAHCWFHRSVSFLLRIEAMQKCTVVMKARLKIPNEYPLEALLNGGDLRERKCFAYQLVSAKKVAVDLSGGIRVSENPDGTTNFEFNFQAPGRFAPSDFHPNFEGLKNGLVFCMNMNQLPSYSQLTSVCELIGIKMHNVASIPELNDQLATSKQIRALALFVYDNTTHLANAIPCSVPSINRIAELVQVVRAKFPKQKEGKDVAIEIDRKPPILTAATVDSRAPRSMIVIEEPLTSSDVVSILAVAAGALETNRRRKARGGVLQKLSYGRASFWDAVMTTVNKPDNRASQMCSSISVQSRVESSLSSLEQTGTRELGQGDSGIASLSSLDSTAGGRKHGPVLADVLRDPVAAYVFYKKLPLPEHTRKYTNFVISCFNEFGFATDLLHLYKELTWNKNKYELPDEEDMGFQNLVRDRIYNNVIASANECKGYNSQQIAFGTEGTAYSYNIKTLFQMVQDGMEKEQKPPGAPEHQIALPNPDEQPEYTWSISAAYAVPACMLWGVARLNSHLALTPVVLHPHRLKEYNRSQASVALEFLFSWDYDLTPLTRIKSAKLVPLGHDIGHPGVGNASLIASRNLCAIMFNEKAVLESYHSFLLMELLRKPELDILAGFPIDVQQAARQRIVRAILATDPAFHFQLADELEALKTSNPDISGPAFLLDEKTKDACLMKAADNAWVLTNFALHRKWGERMVLELHFQNTLDEALKLPPSAPSVISLPSGPICLVLNELSSDFVVQLPRETCLATTMIHFIDNVFVPFYSILAWFFPGDLDTRICVMQANSATWERVRQESGATEGVHQAEELKEMRLATIAASLKALGEEMEFQSSKVITDEASNPKLIDCYQYDEAPYRELLEEQQRLLDEQRRQQEELEFQRELAFQASRREEERKLREEEERKATEEAARKLKEEQEEEQRRKEERRRRRSETGSDSESDTSNGTFEAEEDHVAEREKARPSISPLAEGFKSIIEKELIRSRRHSQDVKSINDGEGIAADGLRPLPCNVIDELEPDIEPEGPMGYEADVQAIAALLAAKRMQAAVEEKEEGETPPSSHRTPLSPKPQGGGELTQQVTSPRQAPSYKTNEQPTTHQKQPLAVETHDLLPAVQQTNAPTPASTPAPPEQHEKAPQLPEVKQASIAQIALMEDTQSSQAATQGDDFAPEPASAEQPQAEAVITTAAPPNFEGQAAINTVHDENQSIPVFHDAQGTAHVAEVGVDEAAAGETQAEATEEGEPVVQFDEYGFVYDEHGYAYDAQGICRGYFGQDGTFYYYDVGVGEAAEGEQQQQAEDDPTQYG